MAQGSARSAPWGIAVILLVGQGATCDAQHVQDPPTVLAEKIEVREVLGPGDVVELRVFNEPDLSGEHQISQEGSIRLPLIGAVPVAGLSAAELAGRLEHMYNEKFLNNAAVTVNVKAYNSRKIYVLGEVAKPGPYPFEGRMTLIGAIARAGGTTKLADANRTLITRDKEGQQVRVLVPVAQIGRGQAPDVELQPGDIIFVPETLF